MEYIDGIPMQHITGNDHNLQYVETLGTGGYGRVYMMRVINSGKLFARKTIRVSREVTREEIENEAKALRSLRKIEGRLNIIKVFRHGWMKLPRAEVYLIDMELGKGTLRDRIREVYSRTYGFYRDELWATIGQLAAGLAELHKHGIIHRDLKPANIIGTWNDGKLHRPFPIWKIADFGITTAGTSKNLIATDNQRGTILYLAPEIILAQPGVPSYTNKVDLWSLGAIVYELCTGNCAFATFRWNFANCPQICHESDRTFDRNDYTIDFDSYPFDKLRDIALAFDIKGLMADDLLGRISTQDVFRKFVNACLRQLLQESPFRRMPAAEIKLLTACAALHHSVLRIIPHICRELTEFPNVEPCHPIVAERWQFLLKIQSIWSHVTVGYQRTLLLEFLERFLEQGIDNAALDHALFKAFFRDFYLCGEFKRLFVYFAAGEGYPKRGLEKVENLPAWALMSNTFHEYLLFAQPDIIDSDEKVNFESELVTRST